MGPLRFTMTIGSTVGAIAGGLLGGALMVGFSAPAQDETIEVLNVKRLNVVEDDGRFALVLANSNHLPGVVRNGKEASGAGRRGVGGLLYYNSRGDEVGGLIANVKPESEAGDGGVQLSMDQLNDQGQAISLMHWMSNGFVRSALRFYDLPTDKPLSSMHTSPRVNEIAARLQASESEEEAEAIYREYQRALGEEGLWAERIYLGTEGAGARRAMLELRDSNSQTRIRLLVDEHDQPRIEFLDAGGEVLRTWTDAPPK